MTAGAGKRRRFAPVQTRAGRVLLLGGAVAAACLLVLTFATAWQLKPVPKLAAVTGDAAKAQLLDRHGRPLTVTYRNRWNRHNRVALYEVPPLLQNAFIISEDKRFFRHGGVDRRARLHAAWQNLRARDTVRGASTLSEQVVRMLHPRPRTLWSRWLEGVEARRLEATNSKAAILEFYLNQVPYAAQRRGVVQAADYYFGRDLATLTEKEQLALAVTVRAPAHFNVHERPETVERRVHELAARMRRNHQLAPAAHERIEQQPLRPGAGARPVQARHFARYVYEQTDDNSASIHTTLDATLQTDAQRILDQRLDYLDDRHIDNAALLAVDHRRNEILAWAVASNGQNASAYDAVRRPRQPGSALKPFVYASALAKGWTAATPIDDSPLSESVGHGLHTYRNYSRTHYGRVSLREALGNSLNIPAVRAVQFVGPPSFLDTLHNLGIHSLDRHPDHYGDGLALGNGELTLFELVQAYAALARGGVLEPLRAVNDSRQQERRRVFDEPVAALIGNILSDPDARRLEFGAGGLLNLPVQTAVKTGTSSDYRDAWAMGYNSRFAVGVWMGNLSGRPMKKVTGATGPALVLRAVFAELNRNRPARPLPFSHLLTRRPVCVDTGRAPRDGCATREEWFAPGRPPEAATDPERRGPVRIRQPHPGLQMAQDPRIPDEAEAFEFRLSDHEAAGQVKWFLNGKRLARTSTSRYTWPLQQGTHTLYAVVEMENTDRTIRTRPVEFTVK